jgi:hypothetical protein
MNVIRAEEKKRIEVLSCRAKDQKSPKIDFRVMIATLISAGKQF